MSERDTSSELAVIDVSMKAMPALAPIVKFLLFQVNL